MASVEIYVKTTCPYCVRATRLLDGKGANYSVHVIDFDPEKRQEMMQRASGRTTVPQIFIAGRHVGGCDDLMTLEQHGKLDALLAA
ncbi:MAG: glutaredoxin 3 [Pseudomonadota bacterium]|nr:glutaredoxin 3 [Pseudomonadota bacterium]